MDNLAKCLRYYIADRLNSDPGWKNLTVSLPLSPLREMEEVFGLGWDPAEEQQKFDRFVSRPGSELLLTVGRPAPSCWGFRDAFCADSSISQPHLL